MADNVTSEAVVTAGSVFAADDIGSVFYPRTKIGFGVDGSYVDASATDPFPIYIVSALPAGTNNIGDVDVLSVIPGTGATNLGKAIDGAAGSTDTGVAPLAIRDDALSSLTPAEGDYVPLRVDSTGGLWVAISGTVTVASHAVTNAGTFAVQAAQSGTWNITNVSGTISLPTGASTLAEQQSQTTALQLIDDAIYADDADWTDETSKHALVGGLYQSTPQSITDGDVGPFQVTQNGYLIVSVNGTATISGTVTANAGTNLNTSALALESGGNLATCATALGVMDDWDETNRCAVNLIASQTGITGNAGAVAANTPRVTLASDDPAVASLASIVTAVQLTDNLVLAEDAAHSTGQAGLLAFAVRRDTAAVGSDTDGDLSTINVNSLGRVYVTATVDAALPTGTNVIGGVTQSGTWNVGTITTITAVSDAQVQGKAAHDASVSGNPILVGGYASATAPTDVSAGGDAVRAWMLLNGSQAVTVTAAGALIGGDATNGLDVDVTRVIPGTSATHLGKAVDNAGGATDTGVATLAIRDDALGGLIPAEGDYANLRVDANGAVWTHDNALSAALSGSELQVDVVASLPAGTNAIGKLAANSGVDIGDVDVTSIVPGTSATNLGKAEDAAHTSGDTGVFALTVRSDTAASTAGTDGDYAALTTDSTGRLHVNVGNTVTVSNAGLTELAAAIDTEVQCDIVGALPAGTNNIGDVDVLSVIPGVGATNLGKAEDAAHTSGDVGVMVLAVRQDSQSDFGADGDYVPLSIDADGALRVSSSGGGGTQYAEDAAHASGNTGTLALVVRQDTPGNLSGTDGDYEALQVSAGRVWASAVVTSLPASTNTIEVVGDVAHDAAAAGNPLRIGAKAETALSGITLVADGDATDLHAGADGVLIVRPHTGLEDVVQERTTNTDGASTAFASGLAAPGAGIRLWITTVTICNSSAAFCTVDLRDGSAGSVLWTLPVPATGGVTMNFNPPLKLTANTALAFDASAGTTTLTISASGFKSKL